MLRWQADQELAALLRRYYQGEAGLWGEIQRHADADLRQRTTSTGPYHLRFLPRPDGYDVLAEPADAYLAGDN